MFSITDGLKLPQTIEFAQRAEMLLWDADIGPLSDTDAGALTTLIKEALPLGIAAKKALDEETETPPGKLKGFVRSAARVFSAQEYSHNDIYRDHLLALSMVRLLAKEAFESRLKYVENAAFTETEIKAMRNIEHAFIMLNVPEDSLAHSDQVEGLYSASTEGRVTSTCLLMDMHKRGIETYHYGGEIYVRREPLQPDQKHLPER